MNIKFRLLSYYLDRYTPLYGDTPAVKITYERQIKNGDSCNTAVITFQNHSGTHIDAPRHFFDSGRRISDFAIGDFVFCSPQVIDCPKRRNQLVMPGDLKSLRKCDLLLIRTGFHRYRKRREYRLNNPGISPGAALLIRRRHPHIRAVGIDSISISAFKNRPRGRQAHKILLTEDHFPGRPVCLIEDMDLSGNLKNLKKVYVAPLYFKKIDSISCTVIGEIHE